MKSLFDAARACLDAGRELVLAAIHDTPFDVSARVEILRDIVLVGKLPNMILYGWTLFISLFSFYFGYWFFDRYRNVIVDVL